MEWYNETTVGLSKNELVGGMTARKFNIFEQNSKSTYYERFVMYDNVLCRFLILVFMVMILLLIYCHNSMDYALDDRSHGQNYHVQHDKLKVNTKRVATPRTNKITNNINIQMHTYPVDSFELITKETSQPKAVTVQKTKQKSPQKIKTTALPMSRHASNIDCKMYSCFNYTRCPLSSKFPVYLYDLDALYNGIEGATAPIKDMLSVNNYITTVPQEACIFLVITELPFVKSTKTMQSYKMINEKALNILPHWGLDGQNHVLLNLGQSRLAEGTDYAMVAQSMFTHDQFRPDFDIVIPPAHGLTDGEVWNTTARISPARRIILMSFQGPKGLEVDPNPKRDALVRYLKQIGLFSSNFYCERVDKLSDYWVDDWPLCNSRISRRKKLMISTFALIIAPGSIFYASTNLLQTRLYEALEVGAVPVILGGDRIRLPFEEVLDWRKAVIRLPMARVTELKYLLEHISDEDILAFRKQGRMLWERYLSTVKASIDTLLAVIRTRLDIPPRPAMAERPATSEFSGYNLTEDKSVKNLSLTETTSEEIFVPYSRLYQPNSYKRNFTVGLLNGYELWNLWGDPFALYPELPWDPEVPIEARASSLVKYPKACSSIAGRRPFERFTIVILTSSSTSDTMLNNSISRLSQLRYLHKIVVVCNKYKPSSEDWPTTVPIKVMRVETNSLNNRFLPYDQIETEAVFCLDDHTVPPLRKEIIFAFNVWREHRDQIVGFYGRSFEWDDGAKKRFQYKTSNTVCEVSMVLTGAAFLHRYYLRAYWRQLPHSVRRFVDKHNNCEDIAMNFLIAYLSRKPPIKVTSTWLKEMTYRSQGRDINTYNSSVNMRKRHRCINYFSKVLGYNPLLNSHYRVSYF